MFQPAYLNSSVRRTPSPAAAPTDVPRPWLLRFLEGVRLDLRLGVRQLKNHASASATVLIVLALAIGTNVAIFNLLYALLYAAPGYPHPESVVRVVPVDPKNPRQPHAFSYRAFRDFRDGNKAFVSVGAYRNTLVGLGQAGDARRAIGAFVSQDYFRVLGVLPAEGRPFLAEESDFGAGREVAIVSAHFWKKYGYPRDLLGHTVEIGHRKLTVVGVMPKDFKGTLNLFSTEVWLPVGLSEIMENGEATDTVTQNAEKFSLIGRLKPGVSLAAANAEVAALAPALGGSFVATVSDPWTLRLEPPTRFASVENDRAVNWIGMILLALAGVVLLIACLNLANMFLARGSVRGQEIAIRYAMGAVRSRVIRQLVTEGAVLAALGGVAGLVLALWSSDLLIASLGRRVPIELSWTPHFEPALLVATAGFSFLATLVFAFAPAVRLTRSSIMVELNEKGGAGRSRRRLSYLPRNWLVVVQIALSLALLTTAALFVRAAGKAASIDTGMKTDRNFLLEVDAGLSGLTPARAQDLYLRIHQSLTRLPQVQQVGLSVDVPFGGIDLQKRVRRAEGDTNSSRPIDAKWNSVDADFFSAVGLPILRGRNFTSLETDQGGDRVIIINEVLEEKLWGRGQGLGQSVEFVSDNAVDTGSAATPVTSSASSTSGAPSGRRILTVVGIVPPTRHVVFETQPDPDFYLPFASGFQSHVYFHVQLSSLAPGAEEALTRLFRKTIREVDPTTPILSIKTFSQYVETNVQIWITRTGAAIFSVFGGIALVLATAGAYGVIAYSVARRSREIGIRLALGAQRGDILRMILSEGAVMLIAGITLGLVLSFGLGRVVSRMLYGVGASDPIAFGGALSVLAASTFFACWLPASRSTRVDPSASLRAV